jgi:hypothetical protein
MTNLIQRWKEHQKVKREKELKERAEELFQLCEHEGEMWLTYDGYIVLPTRYINIDPILLVRQMRQAYINEEI